MAPDLRHCVTPMRQPKRSRSAFAGSAAKIRHVDSQMNGEQSEGFAAVGEAILSLVLRVHAQDLACVNFVLQDCPTLFSDLPESQALDIVFVRDQRTEPMPSAEFIVKEELNQRRGQTVDDIIELVRNDN